MVTYMVGRMKYRKKAAFAILSMIVLMLLSGCYPKRVGPAGPGGKALTWPEMTVVQRQTHMQRAVLPRAAAIFRSWRPDHYDDITCHLCHVAQGFNPAKADCDTASFAGIT